jgi:hypothetical protein
MHNPMIDDNIIETYTMDNRNRIPQETTIANVRLATAYVPFQRFCTTYSPIKSLVEGTVFPELCSPYSPMMSEKIKLKEKKPWTEMLY